MYGYQYMVLGLFPKDGDKYNLTLDGEVFENITPTLMEDYEMYTAGNLALGDLGDDTGEPYLLVVTFDSVTICVGTEGDHTVSLEMVSPIVEKVHKIDGKYVDMDTPYEIDGDTAYFSKSIELPDGTDLYFGRSGHSLIDTVNDLKTKTSVVQSGEGNSSVVIGWNNNALGTLSFARGELNIASKMYSVADGKQNISAGEASFARNHTTISIGKASNSEGNNTAAVGDYSHVEGQDSYIGKLRSGTLETSTKIKLLDSDETLDQDYLVVGRPIFIDHSSYANPPKQFAIIKEITTEGNNTYITIENALCGIYTGQTIYFYLVGGAIGIGSHAEGFKTIASAGYTHAEGYGTIAISSCQHVQGKYNIEDSENKYAHIVGNGTNDNERSNIHTVDWDGNGWFAGTVETDAIILHSSTEGSTKKFKVTIDDTGTLAATEITE